MSVLTTKLKFVAVDWLWITMILLALAGIGISAYLMWGYTVPGATLACGASSGCEAVKNSDYANLGGIPLPLMGLAAYLVLLGLVVAQNQADIFRRDWSPYIALAIFGVSLVGMLYSAYLTYIELYVIYAVCRWCIASAGIITLLFLLSIFNLHNGGVPKTEESAGG